jgi:hypothetical protein
MPSLCASCARVHHLGRIHRAKLHFHQHEKTRISKIYASALNHSLQNKLTSSRHHALLSKLRSKLRQRYQCEQHFSRIDTAGGPPPKVSPRVPSDDLAGNKKWWEIVLRNWRTIWRNETLAREICTSAMV